MSRELDGYLETIQPELISTARLFGFSESKVKVMLMRTRNKLKARLETEGLL